MVPFFYYYYYEILFYFVFLLQTLTGVRNMSDLSGSSVVGVRRFI